MKRKITSEKERYGGYDSVIEVDEVKPKSYRTVEDDTDLRYTTLERFAQTKPQSEFMPKIASAEELRRERQREQQRRTASETKPEVAPKQRVAKEALSTKTKIMLAVYVAAAVLLAAVVIGTGLAISGNAERVTALEGQIAKSNVRLAEVDESLLFLNDPTYLRGLANEPGSNLEAADEIEEIEMMELSEPVIYSADSNWFDKICAFIANIFT